MTQKLALWGGRFTGGPADALAAAESAWLVVEPMSKGCDLYQAV